MVYFQGFEGILLLWIGCSLVKFLVWEVLVDDDKWFV